MRQIWIKKITAPICKKISSWINLLVVANLQVAIYTNSTVKKSYWLGIFTNVQIFLGDCGHNFKLARFYSHGAQIRGITSGLMYTYLIKSRICVSLPFRPILEINIYLENHSMFREDKAYILRRLRRTFWTHSENKFSIEKNEVFKMVHIICFREFQLERPLEASRLAGRCQLPVSSRPVQGADILDIKPSTYVYIHLHMSEMSKNKTEHWSCKQSLKVHSTRHARVRSRGALEAQSCSTMRNVLSARAYC